jgi:hypothetical protein
MITNGQIESFVLISQNAYGCQYAKYVAKTFKGYKSVDEEARFYAILNLIDILDGYNQYIETNCLDVVQIEAIMQKLKSMLCFTFNLNDLPFVTPDFNHEDFFINDFF